MDGFPYPVDRSPVSSDTGHRDPGQAHGPRRPVEAEVELAHGAGEVGMVDLATLPTSPLTPYTRLRLRAAARAQHRLAPNHLRVVGLSFWPLEDISTDNSFYEMCNIIIF